MLVLCNKQMNFFLVRFPEELTHSFGRYVLLRFESSTNEIKARESKALLQQDAHEKGFFSLLLRLLR